MTLYKLTEPTEETRSDISCGTRSSFQGDRCLVRPNHRRYDDCVTFDRELLCTTVKVDPDHFLPGRQHVYGHHQLILPMEGSTSDNAAPNSTVPSIQSIKKCLLRCQRQFIRDTDHQSTSGEEWTRITKHKSRGITRRRGNGPRAPSFWDNKPFVQGIYVVTMGLRYVFALWSAGDKLQKFPSLPVLMHLRSCAYLVDTILVDRNHVETFNQQFSSVRPSATTPIHAGLNNDACTVDEGIPGYRFPP